MTLTHRDLSILDFLVTDDEHVGHTLPLRLGDLDAHGLVLVVHLDAAAMRTAIKHERRIELAFEDHRYWDLRRWDDAGTVLNRPLRGVKVTRSGDGFAYTPFEVAKRIFDAPKMNLYPIPQAEIVKSGGVLDQNPGW